MTKSDYKSKNTPKTESKGPVEDTLVETPKWYNHSVFTNAPKPPTQEEIEKYLTSKERKKAIRNYDAILGITASELHAAAVQALESYNNKLLNNAISRADQRWIDDMLRGGTISDKVSALTLQIKSNPTRSLSYLDSLLSIAQKKGRRETNTAVDALCELFAIDLLPADRKLSNFSSQKWVAAYCYHTTNFEKSPIPHTHPYATRPDDMHLAMWALEDGIKARFNTFINILEEGVHDTLLHIKRARINNVYSLLKAVPEGEDTLLAIIVNKLGDNERKVASKAQFLLNELIENNPGMKLAVVKEIERLLFRPNIRSRAQYYALTFLNQMLFTESDYVLAQALIGLYLSLFRVIINNAIPIFDDRIHQRKKLIQKNKKLLKEGKTKLAKKVRKLAAIEDEGVNKKILGALLTGISRALPYTQYAPDDDPSKKLLNEVLAEHTDVLFKLINKIIDSDTSHFAVAVQALALLYQIIPLKEDIRNRYYIVLYKSLLVPEIAHNAKVMIYMNVLYKSLKNDSNTTRVIAFAKRALQVGPMQGIPFMCSMLFILSEVAKTNSYLKKGLKSHEATSTIAKPSIAIDEDEKEEAKQDKDAKKNKNKNSKNKDAESDADDEDNESDDEDNESDDDDEETKDSSSSLASRIQLVERVLSYDASEGDPMYAHADLSALWELLPLVKHFHPSVGKFSSILSQEESISYAGNPLQDFTRAKFLEKFVNKSAKKSTTTKLSSMASRHRPVVKLAIGDAKDTGEDIIETFTRDPKQIQNIDVNSINETDKFFYQYFKDRASKDTPFKRVLDEDEDAFAERIMEEELLKMSGISRAEVDEMDALADHFEVSSDSELEAMIAAGNKRKFDQEIMPTASKKQKKQDMVTKSTRGVFDSDDEEGEVEEFGDDDDDVDMDDLDVDEFDGVSDGDDDDVDDAPLKGGAMFSDTFADADEFAELLESAGTSETAIGDKHTEMLEKFGYSKGRAAIKKQIKQVKKSVRK